MRRASREETLNFWRLFVVRARYRLGFAESEPGWPVHFYYFGGRNSRYSGKANPAEIAKGVITCSQPIAKELDAISANLSIVSIIFLFRANIRTRFIKFVIRVDRFKN
jgi:hypothetical protein